MTPRSVFPAIFAVCLAGCTNPPLPPPPRIYRPETRPEALPYRAASEAEREEQALVRHGLEDLRSQLAVGSLRPWRYIVLHHSATADGNAAEFDKLHKDKGWDGLGYHFVIGNGTDSRDGEIEVGWRWRDQREGAHAGETIYNQLGVGICLVGNFEKTRPTARQDVSLRKLMAYVRDRCDIPADAVIGHGQIKNTECPGKNFRVEDYAR